MRINGVEQPTIAITPPVRLLFTKNLFEASVPKIETATPMQKKYSITAVFQKDEDTAEVRKAIRHTVLSIAGDEQIVVNGRKIYKNIKDSIQKIVMSPGYTAVYGDKEGPLRDGTSLAINQAASGRCDIADGRIIMVAKTIQRPRVLGVDGLDVNSYADAYAAGIYDGCLARVVVKGFYSAKNNMVALSLLSLRAVPGGEMVEGNSEGLTDYTVEALNSYLDEI